MTSTLTPASTPTPTPTSTPQKKVLIATLQQQRLIATLSQRQLQKVLEKANEVDGEIIVCHLSNKPKMVEYICGYALAVELAMDELAKRTVSRVMCTGTKIRSLKGKMTTINCGREIGWGDSEKFPVKLCASCQEAKEGKGEVKESKEVKKRPRESIDDDKSEEVLAEVPVKLSATGVFMCLEPGCNRPADDWARKKDVLDCCSLHLRVAATRELQRLSDVQRKKSRC